ncbi:MAG TPA: ATP-binding protein [Terriglobales bacterium]|nr:ATP-binding protein [Terriglobales bacterium]
MINDIDLRCDPKDSAGLLREIERRDRIIAALMNRVQRDLDSTHSDFSLLQATFMLEEEVSRRTQELEVALDALTNAKRDVEAVRQRLVHAISAIPEGFALFDPDDKLILSNEAYRKLWDFDEDVNGRKFADLLSEAATRLKPGDSEWIARRLHNHRLAAGTSEDRLANGRLLQIRERRTPDGFTVGLYTDITELAELQAADAARRQLLAVVDFLPDATFAIDGRGRVIAWNRAMEEITGVKKADILGEGDRAYAMALYGERRATLLDALDSDDPELISRYENLRRKGSSVSGEVFLASVYGGRGAYLDLIASPLLDREGKRVGAIECIRDITDRKRAYADLQSLQEQLRQAVKMEAIGRLAGGIAHDFNNQLTIVQSYSKLLLNRLPCGLSDCAREVNEIFRAAERSAQLTKQLLAFGRKQVLHSEVLDFNAVLTELRDPLARMIGEDVHLDVQITDDLWSVKTDRNQLEQAIVNLAVNARDAMPHGGRLTIEARNAVLDSDYVLRHMGASEGEHVCLRVKDSGIGMDQPTQARIFEPFFTTKPVGVGTGLGLSLVYGFVKQSGGHIDVSTELGRGSCFDLYFPRAIDAVVAQEAQPSADRCASGNETILVVEDQEALRVLTSHILESGGYHVLQAEDGYSAIELSRQYDSNIDLVLSDVVMPGLSGPEVVKELTRHRPGLKVIYVTGYADGNISGTDELRAQTLTKPFTPEILSRVIRQVLDPAGNN